MAEQTEALELAKQLRADIPGLVKGIGKNGKPGAVLERLLRK